MTSHDPHRPRRSMRMAAVAVAVASSALLPSAGHAEPTPGTEAVAAPGVATNLTVVGRSDLGGQGLNGDVAVSGNIALVGAGFVPMNTMQGANTKQASDNNAPPCATVPVKVVDLSDPTKPAVAATIPVPKGQAAPDVDILRVSTPAFKGELGAVAFASCDYDVETFRTRGVVLTGSFADRGVAFYDLSTPSKPRFLGRYMADFENVDPEAPPCGPPPTGADNHCAQDIFSVELKRIRDGRILALATRNDGADRSTPATDVRILDVTDPAKPQQIGTWPPLGQAPARTSNLGCYPRAGSRNPHFSADGTKIYVPYLDGGLFTLDVKDLASPKAAGQWTYPDDWKIEGNAAAVDVAQVNGKDLALVADEDWWWPTSIYRVTSPAGLAGDKLGCSDLFTSADQKFVSQIFRHPNAQLPGELAYVGRGCPDRRPGLGALVPADPYLSDPRGKLLFADDNINTVTQPTLNTNNCTFNSRVRRAQDAGALGVVLITRNPVPFSIAGFPPTGSPREPTDQNAALTGDVSIPGFQVNQPDGFAIRNVLCPSNTFVAGPTPNTGTCTPTSAVTGALVDLPGAWGGLRVVDVTDPVKPVEKAQFKTPRASQMPPPDYRGIYSVHHAVVEGDRAYVAWNGDGLRVLDLGSGVPAEIGSFVPPDTPDPTGTIPAKARVQGVAFNATHVVVTDVNSGLYVLEKPGPFGGRGYWLAGADGGVFALGDTRYFGSVTTALRRPVVALVPTSTGQGYWLVADDGGVFAFGDAPYKGSTGGRKINAPIVALLPTRTNQGYWLVGADGGVYAFGDATFHGSAGALRLNKPIVGGLASATGAGYLLTAADGGVFAYGDAVFRGSTGALRLNKPIVGVAATANGLGYWMVASDGGVFAFGDAPFKGSTGALTLRQPIIGMAPLGGGSGYWLTAADGGVFAFGAPFLGGLAGTTLAARIVSVAAQPR